MNVCPSNQVAHYVLISFEELKESRSARKSTHMIPEILGIF